MSTENDRLGIGGNAPPPDLKLGDDLLTQLASDNLDLTARRDELIASAQRFNAEHATVEDDEISGRLAAFLVQISKCEHAANVKRVDAKAPYLQGEREVDSFFNKDIRDPLLKAFGELNRKQTAFGVAKANRERLERQRLADEQRAREEAARQAAAEAERVRLAAEKAAARAERKGDTDKAAVQQTKAYDAAAAQTAAQEAQAEAAHSAMAAESAAARPTAELSRTKGTYASMSVQETWSFSVTDMNLVPREYLMINESMVKAAIRGKNGKREIPGIEIFPQHSARNRG